MTDSWHGQARCRRTGVDPAWFFPEDGSKTLPDGTVQQVYGENGLRAQLICATCPVRQLCWLENREAEAGIFAGTTEYQRAAMLTTACRQEQVAAKRQHRPRRTITMRDVPGPGQWINFLRSSIPDRSRLVRPPAGKQPPVVSNRLQRAIYAFTHGYTVAQAAALTEIPEKLLRQHITPMERLAS